MGRECRPQIEGAVNHVFSRGNRRGVIFRLDYDFHRFLLYLGDEIVERGWRCLAYTLIPNHYHLVFETPEPNLSAGMHRLNLRWAKAFNKEYGLLGHVFQARFGLRVVRDDLERVLRYVIRNPVEAGLCRDPRDWEWSSYAELVGSAPPRFLVDVQRLAELLGCSTAEVPDSTYVPGMYRVRARYLANQPKPYVPAKRSASRRTSSAAGRPTTFR